MSGPLAGPSFFYGALKYQALWQNPKQILFTCDHHTIWTELLKFAMGIMMQYLESNGVALYLKVYAKMKVLHYEEFERNTFLQLNTAGIT